MPAGFATALCLTMVVPALSLIIFASETVRTFDDEPPGRPPAGFSFRVTRDASPAKWLLQRDGTNGFLAHVGDPSARARFSLAILDDTAAGAEWVSVRARMAGPDGTLGVLWRVQDADNYYLAKLDLSRQDIGLYRVVRGNRVRIEGEDDLELDPNAWHTLKVVQDGDSLRVYIGGIRVLRARDRTFGTSGAAGVWCTGDAVAHFDDVKIGRENDEGPRRRR